MSRSTEKEKPSEKILITAFESLSTKGYANVSMRNIADEAGVALSQLTYYYKNKERLFTEVINTMIQQYLHEIENNLKNAKDPKEKFSSLVRFFKELIRERPKLLRLFIDFTAQALWIPSFGEQVNGLFHELTKAIEGTLLVDTEIKKNMPGYSPRALANLILGALYGTSIQIILNSEKESVFESLDLAESLFNQ